MFEFIFYLLKLYLLKYRREPSLQLMLCFPHWWLESGSILVVKPLNGLSPISQCMSR